MLQFRSSVAFAALLLGVLGCSKKDSAAPTPKESKPAVPSVTPTLPTAAMNTGDSGAPALKAATDFLKAVQDGKATSASLTPAFKKVIAPPELEADKAVGYSESGVQIWLANAKTKMGFDNLKVDSANADFALASADYQSGFKVRGGPGKTYLRLIRSDTIWLIDYAILGTQYTKLPLPTDGQAARAFAAIAFVEALVAQDVTAVEWLLSKSAKAKLAPPLFDTDKEQGYSKSKLKSVIGDMYPSKPIFTGLAGDGEAIKVELNLNGAVNALNLKLVPGPTPGSYLIDDLQQK